MARQAPTIQLSPEGEEVLNTIVRAPTSAQRDLLRARIALLAAKGQRNDQIREALGVSIHGGRAGEGGKPQRRSVLDGRSRDLRAGVSPPASLTYSRAGLAVRLQGRRARQVRKPCCQGIAGASYGRWRRDQSQRYGQDRRLLAGFTAPREQGAAQRPDRAVGPRDRVHHYNQVVQTAGSALGWHSRAGRRAVAGMGTRGTVPPGNRRLRRSRDSAIPARSSYWRTWPGSVRWQHCAFQ